MRGLTHHQQRTFDCIRDWIDKHGTSPTMQQLTDELGLHSYTAEGVQTDAVSNAYKHVKALVRKGVLSTEPSRRERGPDGRVSTLPMTIKLVEAAPQLSADVALDFIARRMKRGGSLPDIVEDVGRFCRLAGRDPGAGADEAA